MSDKLLNDEDQLKEQDEILKKQEEIISNQKKIEKEEEKIEKKLDKVEESGASDEDLTKIEKLKANVNDVTSVVAEKISDLDMVDNMKEKTSAFRNWWNANQSNVLPLVASLVTLVTFWYNLNKDQIATYNTRLHEMLKNKPLIILEDVSDKGSEVEVDSLLAKLSSKDQTSSSEQKKLVKSEDKKKNNNFYNYGTGYNSFGGNNSQQSQNGEKSEEKEKEKVKTQGLIYKLKVSNIGDISTFFSWTHDELSPADLKEKFQNLDPKSKPNYVTIAPNSKKDSIEINLINPSPSKPLYIYFFDQTSNTWIKQEYKVAKSGSDYNFTRTGVVNKDDGNSWVTTEDR